MEQYLKLSSLVFTVLCILFMFILGAFIPGVSGMAEKDGMTGGATVVIAGLIGGILGLILSLVLISRIAPKMIVMLNWILFIVLVLAFFLVLFPSSR